MLSVNTIHIIPRQLVEDIGGWRDRQRFADVDFAKRAKLMLRSQDYPFILKERSTLAKKDKGISYMIRDRYRVCVCSYMLGLKIFRDISDRNSYYRPFIFIIATVALFVVRVKRISQFKYEDSAR